MNRTEFEGLQYGNVITDSTGNDFVVLHVMRDGSGKAKNVGILPALGPEKGEGFSVKSKDHSETYLAGRSVIANP